MPSHQEDSAEVDPEATGSDSNGPLVVEVKNLTVKRHVAPAFPPDAPRDAEVECDLVVDIDEQGLATQVVVEEECSEPFRSAIVEAYGQWKWKPHEVDGEAVPVRVSSTVLFIP